MPPFFCPEPLSEVGRQKLDDLRCQFRLNVSPAGGQPQMSERPFPDPCDMITTGLHPGCRGGVEESRKAPEQCIFADCGDWAAYCGGIPDVHGDRLGSVRQRERLRVVASDGQGWSPRGVQGQQGGQQATDQKGYRGARGGWVRLWHLQ